MTRRGDAFLGFCAAILTLGILFPASADDGDIVIAIKDGAFVPSEVSVPAGAKVKLVVRNQDASMSEFESLDFHREKAVPPGSEISIFIGPLDAGSYEFFDDFHPAYRGHLIVK